MKQQILSYQFCLDLVVFTFLLRPGLYVPRTARAMAEDATSYRAAQARLVKGTGDESIPGLSKVAVEKHASKLVL